LAHYPRIEASKAGVILSDLSGAIVKNQVSLIAVCAVCDEAWQEATPENPWPLPTGELLKRMLEKTQSYRFQLERLANPAPQIAKKPPSERVDPYEGRKWPEFTPDDQVRLWSEIKGMPYQLKNAIRRSFSVPDDIIEPGTEENTIL